MDEPLPPHELRAFLASVGSVPSQSAPTPGISPVGATPPLPLTGATDPYGFATILDGIAIAPMTPTAGDPFAALAMPGGVAYVPLATAPSEPSAPHSIDGPPTFDASLFEVQHVPLIEHGIEQAPKLESKSQFDPHVVRRDFPILEERVHGGKRLVWLDNAATTQKPRSVIDRLVKYYEHENSNVHRAAHALAARATDAYEGARETTRKFLNASSPSEIVFVRGATEGINLIAKAWGKRYIERGDEIVVTHLEHHANIVPWQQLCQEVGARLRVAPVDDRGDVILDEYEKLMCSRTKLVAFTQVSNALGTVTPARAMIEIAHRWGATVVLDGAQAVSHMPVDVQALDCDFYVFSGHKVFAPTGIGAVFGKRPLLDATPPWQGGGNMIRDVTFERTLYQDPPWRFEAGTGNIADAAGMAAALDYVMGIGLPAIDRYEHELMAYAHAQLQTVRGLRCVGNPREKAGVLSFVLDGHRTEDVGAALDQEGIAVRSGHHCAQPILRRFGLESSVRASLALYNTREDIDALTSALRRLQASL
ncbi:MAG TPA: family 2A encapsulin nanocompartment cargo protein cysteine desulfurase [Kofleriaceae bacterium]|jgi:cysteine desulfurase/selenocysteine lyase